MRELLPFKSTVSNLELQDNISVDLGTVTVTKRNGLHKIEELGHRPYEKKNNVWVAITFERNLGIIEL